jgi:hypothetical protein
MNIFILTWLDLGGKMFKTGYDAAKQYKTALNCNSIATTISQQTLTSKKTIEKYGKTTLDMDTKQLVGVDPGEETMASGGGTRSGTLDEQFKRLQGDDKNCYVVSTNKSHNLSWVLSKQAFQKFPTSGRTKVVINMDQHTDCGTSTDPLEADSTIQCSNWGQYHLKYEGCGDDERYYVVLGCSNKYLNKSGIFWNKPKSKSPSGYEQGGDTAVLDKMKKEMEILDEKGKVVGKKDCDVYITIDNDVFNTPMTHYEAGVLEEETVWELLDNALGTMNKLNVVGGDVTGLPSQGGKSQAAIATSKTKAGMTKITDLF